MIGLSFGIYGWRKTVNDMVWNCKILNYSAAGWGVQITVYGESLPDVFLFTLLDFFSLIYLNSKCREPWSETDWMPHTCTLYTLDPRSTVHGLHACEHGTWLQLQLNSSLSVHELDQSNEYGIVSNRVCEITASDTQQPSAQRRVNQFFSLQLFSVGFRHRTPVTFYCTHRSSKCRLQQPTAYIVRVRETVE